ncbi:MAG: cyclic nucleotide-binding domain-containing protein [Prochloraceae cyanobacterium]
MNSKQELLQPVRTVQIYQKTPSPKNFLAGAVIFEQGEPGDLVYGIVEGEVEISIKGKVIETLETGDVFGQSALVQPEHKRASTARAKTNCLIAFLDREHFLFAVEQTPIFALEILRSYSNRIHLLRQSVLQENKNGYAKSE